MPIRRPALTLCLSLLILAPAATLLPGCQTRQPGVKSAFGSQFAIVDASVEGSTEAAAAVLEELGFVDVAATSTVVDGEVTGFTPDRTRVEVYVAQEDENKTEVSVTVGPLGDSSVGTEIIAKIRQRLGS